MAESKKLCADCLSVFADDQAVSAIQSPLGLQWTRTVSSMHQNYFHCQLCGTLGELQKPALLHPILARTLKLPKRVFDPSYQFIIKADFKSSGHVEFTRTLRGASTTIKLEASTLRDDPAAAIITERPINHDVTCAATYDKIRQWLKECHEEHTASCHSPNQNPARPPSHLIDVSSAGQDRKIRLIKTSSLTTDAKYVALSYCWGEDQSAKTTTSNYGTYLGSIPIAALPQTLIDAIFVTRQLGLPYLWVDSLCIIQDAQDDKVHEVGRMDAIYSEAHVTIAACTTRNCHETFLQPRQKEQPYITLPFGTSGGHINFRDGYPFYYGYPYPNAGSEPIYSRAWTFQEQFMSPRMLLFTTTQLFWVCAETWGRDGGMITRQQYFGKELELSRRVLSNPQPSDWLRIAQEYSKKRLSDPMDKLPALSSIATYFSERTGLTYHAGLWFEEMPYALCWGVRTKSLTKGEVVPLQPRPAVWRAPSWSWMCVEQQIAYEDKEGLDFQTKHLRRDLSCVIVSCHTEPSSKNAPFGCIRSGFLRVHGRVIKCHPTRYKKDTKNLVRLKEFPPSHKFREEEGLLQYDAQDGGINLISTSSVSAIHASGAWNDPVYCLLLARQRRTVSIYVDAVRSWELVKEWWPFGIALRTLPDGNCYRVGTFWGNGWGLSLFGKVKAQTITIV